MKQERQVGLADKGTTNPAVTKLTAPEIWRITELHFKNQREKRRFYRAIDRTIGFENYVKIYAVCKCKQCRKSELL